MLNEMTKNRTIEFFETQFKSQTRAGEFGLNPFEKIALPFVNGRVLDIGCGLGNISIEVARRGCSVLALDGSSSAVARIRRTAKAERLAMEAEEADLAAYQIAEMFDTIIAIGLLMFFPRDRALGLLEDIKVHVRPGGVAIVNVLIEGTTYLDMFQAGHYYLFGARELEQHFAGWEILVSEFHRFDAPGPTQKAFATVIARRPPLALSASPAT